MRIACLHLPQFALQCVTRIDPALRGAAVAVVGTALPSRGSAGREPGRVGLHSPVVQACSRAAWAVGVRVGMTATAARALCPDEHALIITTVDPQVERETVRALADLLLATTPVVDVGGRVGPGGAHLAMYCEVPTKMRGTSFGDRVLAQLAATGLTARIGIADDRFTAWVAASDHRDDDGPIVSVPRGGSAAFLAPRSLALLGIAPEVLHMLEQCGTSTLGQFASLPAPSIARPIEADYQALARGDSGHTLRPYAPEAPIREKIVMVSATPAHSAAADPSARREPSAHTLTTSAAAAILAERIAQRLAGRARGAAKLELTIAGESGERVVAITPKLTLSGLGSLEAAAAGGGRTVLTSAEAIAEAIGAALVDGDRAAWRLEVAVTGEALVGDGTAPVEDAIDTIETALHDDVIDTLSVVLSTTGSLELGFGRLGPQSASSSRLERRDATHRRTRRGKQRRRVDSLIQPGLFKNLG
ncbi:MAG TPA: hypothetical protein VFQ53_28395 [Kofleriaceae bacterium]|nr:hypothetical protein [Kofleriaceae bacterium]